MISFCHHMSRFRNFWVLSQSRTCRMDPEIFSELAELQVIDFFLKGHTLEDASLVTFILKSRNLCFPLAVLPITDFLYQSGCLDSFEEDRGMKTLTFGSLLVSSLCCTLASQKSFIRRWELMHPGLCSHWSMNDNTNLLARTYKILLCSRKYCRNSGTFRLLILGIQILQVFIPSRSCKRA